MNLFYALVLFLKNWAKPKRPKPERREINIENILPIKKAYKHSDVNWQTALKQKDVKQTSVKQGIGVYLH